MNIKEMSNKMNFELSEEQIKVIEHDNKPLAVVACAGSGKTTTIELKMLYDVLNEKMKPEEILCITFSKLAQLDMDKKYDELSKKFNLNNKKKPRFSTFHAYFKDLLEKNDVKKDIVSDRSKFNLKLQQALKFKLKSGFDVNDGISDILNYKGYLINTLKSDDGLENVTEVPKNAIFTLEEYIKVIETYENWKKDNNCIDFDDMQVLLLDLLKSNINLRKQISKRFHNQFKKIYIDEYQDISALQFAIINSILNKEYNKLIVIGDDDQSIYKFRGSSPEHILDFKTVIPKADILYLSTNYRCPTNILEKAKNVIENNEVRFEKNIQAVNNGGSFNIINDLVLSKDLIDEIKFCFEEKPNETNAVLCRTNLHGSIMADKLIENNIPVSFKSSDNALQSRYEFKEIIYTIELLKNNSIEAFSNIGHKILRKVSRFNINNLLPDVKELKGDWLKAFVKKNIYTKTDLDELNKLQMVAKETDDLNKLLKIVESVLLPFYEDLHENQGSNKIFGFNIIIGYLKAKAFNQNLKYSDFEKENEVKLSQHRMQSIMEEHSGEEIPGVNVLTFHGAKGLEFDNVFIILASNKITPGVDSVEIRTINGDVHDLLSYLEEERRLFYVAMTRAKKHLSIAYTLDQSIFIQEALYEKQKTVYDVIENQFIKDKLQDLILDENKELFDDLNREDKLLISDRLLYQLRNHEKSEF